MVKSRFCALCSETDLCPFVTKTPKSEASSISIITAVTHEHSIFSGNSYILFYQHLSDFSVSFAAHVPEILIL